MNISPAMGMLPEMGAWNGNGNPTTPSLVNSFRITKVVERLASHLKSGSRNDPYEFFNLCLSLSRGIDYALANGETPSQVSELPSLMKQIYQREKDEILLAGVMVLMISVKNACNIGWFQMKESEELLTIADELRKVYCTLGNINTELSPSHLAITTIMERFYPKMKLGPILVSIEAKPGYGASTVDFQITKDKAPKGGKIWLLVAQTDNTETSACLISPQQVNFLLNGKGIDPRTNVRMDAGPQMPTDVTSMLKYGTNLFQAVGQFNGHYIIIVSYMSFVPLPEHQVLPNYVQPAVTIDSDSDIIEGPSRISLNCPISFTRIKTPVKGCSCKHFQCFDFNNFININSKKPSWRCPHCNQYVCYTDIRLDQNMIEILKNVGKDVVEVIVHADGSWKAVLENDQDVDKIQNKAHNCEKEPTEPQESTRSPNRAPSVFDLTNNDNHLEIKDTCETADTKPFHASVPSQFVTHNSTLLGVNTSVVNRIVGGQIADDSWTGIYAANSRSNTPTIGVTEHPILHDTVSPAFNQEAEAMQYQFSATNDLQLVNYRNSLANEYGRSSSSRRHISRTPVAVQALPVQSQPLGPQSSSSAAVLSDTERQQVFSRSSLNLPQVSGVSSSTTTLQHQSATQNRVPPVNISAPTQMQNPYRASRMTEFRNAHLQQALNPQPRQPIQSSYAQRSHIPAGAAANSQQRITPTSHQVTRQGNFQTGIARTAGATSNSQQAWGMATSLAARQSQTVSIQNQSSVAATSFTADIFRGFTGEPRGPAQAVSRPDELFNLPPDQNWHPSRLRGSLSGRPISDDIRQQMIVPTAEQAAQSSSQRPQSLQPIRTPQLDVFIANNRNAYNNSSRHNV